MTLRARLVGAAATLLLVLVAGGLILLHSAHSSQTAAADRQLRAAVPVAVDLAAQHPSTGGDPGASSSPAATLSSVYVARVRDDGARQVLLQPSTITASQPETIPAPPSSGKASQPRTTSGQTGSSTWRVVAVREGQDVSLVVAVPLQPDVLDRASTTVILVARILLLVAVGLCGWWLIRLVLRPLAEVTRVANAISSGDRTRRVVEGRPGTEATTLARAFNEMLDAQHAAEDRLRRFVADASHELRTPVSAIAGFADLYRHGGIEPTQLDDVMRRIGQEASRMRGLVEDLLLLAHLDQGRSLSPSRVDLTALAHDAALDASATHPSRTVTVTGSSHAPATADEAGLRQVLANLLGNALLHTAGAVRIDVTAHPDRVTINVADDGPGLDADTRTHMFDRFWRGAAVRTGTGSGLGLPIVVGIVEAHGGTVEVHSEPGSGTRIEVGLPTRPPGSDRSGRASLAARPASTKEAR